MNLILTLLFAFGLLADSTEAHRKPVPDQTITRAEIEAAGLYRVPDLLRLIPASRHTTIDGLTWRTSLLDGDAFGREEWAIMLDGVRLDMDVLGEKNLSLIPAAISQIDSVEVFLRPTIVAGAFAAGGLIHIHTASPRRSGLSARGGTAIGLQNGDPGPFRYIPELATLNVDKFGPDFEGWAGAAGTNWRASGRFKLLRLYPTHEAVFARNVEILNGADIPRSRLFSAATRLEGQALGGVHDIQLIGGGINDLWFFAPYGRELSTRRLYGQVAATGSFAAPSPGNLTFTYRASVARNKLGRRFEEALGPDPDFRGDVARAGLEAAFRNNFIGATTGAEIEHRDLENARSATIGRITAAAERFRPRSMERIDLALSTADGDLAGAVSLSSDIQAGALNLRLIGSVAQRLPAEMAGPGFWRMRGYGAFEEVLTAPAVEPQVTTTFHGGLRAGRWFGEVTSVHAGAAVRGFRGLYLEASPRAPDPNLIDTERLVVVDPSASGSLLHLDVSGRGATGILEGRVGADLQLTLSGSESFERGREAVPVLRAMLGGGIRPSASFSATSTLHVQSASQWPEYAHLTGGNHSLYDHRIPAMWLLDASLEKTFWKGRLRSALLFQNLLGQQERYHPVGASFNRRMFLRVELLL